MAVTSTVTRAICNKCLMGLPFQKVRVNDSRRKDISRNSWEFRSWFTSKSREHTGKDTIVLKPQIPPHWHTSSHGATLTPTMPYLLTVLLCKGLWWPFLFKSLQVPCWNMRHLGTLLMQRSLKNSHEFALVSFSFWWILFLLFIYRILSEECSPVNFLHICVS